MTGLTILLLKQSLHLERQKDSQPSKLVVLSQRMSKRINSIIEPRHLDSEKGKALTALEVSDLWLKSIFAQFTSKTANNKVFTLPVEARLPELVKIIFPRIALKG